VDLDRERRRYAPAPKPLGKRELRTFLEVMSKEELVEQALQLFADFSEVREYFEMRLGPADDSETVRRKYKRIIDGAFYSPHGEPRLHLSAARKAIRDYRKVARSTGGVVDLMLHYVETGLAFAHDLGFMDEPFARSLTLVFRDALGEIVKAGLQPEFAPRCTKIVESSTGFGWWLPDMMADVYDHALASQAP
jgi:hypothetical protein